MDRLAELRVAVGVAALLAGLAVFQLASEAPGFFDPCKTWGMPNTGSAGMELPTSGPCAAGRTGTSETRVGAALRLALTAGVALLAASLAGWAVLRRRPGPLLAASLLMVGEAVVLFLGVSMLFLVALAAAAAFLLAWRRLRRPPA